MITLLDGLSLLAAPVVSAVVAYRVAKNNTKTIIYKKQEQRKLSPRGARTDLVYGFTLDGVFTGELIPEGSDPSTAAKTRSSFDGKDYGVCRV